MLQRLDTLQEMMGRVTEAQPQGEGEVPEKVQLALLLALLWTIVDAL